MLQALLAGVASIKAQQTRMNVIGNNLANVNTTAYKSSSVTFQDMIAQTITGASRPNATLGGRNPLQFGLGVSVAGTNVDNGQGSLNATNRPTDLAIQGNGYFMVSNGATISYTRDGSFGLDANGDLVQRATGQRVLGWTANGNNVPYGAAKAGITGLTRQLSLEALPEVRINCIAPGRTITGMTTPLMLQRGGDMEQGEKIFGAKIPMQRMGTAAELAAAVCFFLSDDASFITGQTLIVDGGETIS